MAKRSWWDTLWGTPEKINEQQAKYTGPQPYSSMTDFPVGAELNKTILAGLGGQGWGMPAGYTERATSPAIAQLRANAPKTQREVQDVYSSRGLGRGTAVARDVGEVATQRERDINQLLSEAYQADIMQRKQDEANWQTRGSGYAGQEVGTRSGASTFGLSQMGAENTANAENNALRRQYNQDQSSALDKQIMAGLTVALPFAGAGLTALSPAVAGMAPSWINQLGTGLGSLSGGLGGMGGGLAGMFQPATGFAGGAVDKALVTQSQKDAVIAQIKKELGIK